MKYTFDKARVIALANEIESPKEHDAPFDMSKCETCMIGYSFACEFGRHPVIRENRMLMDPEFDWKWSADTMMKWMGYDRNEFPGANGGYEWEELKQQFYMAAGRRSGLPLGDIKREHVVAMLRKLADTGDIDWIGTEVA